MKRAENKTETGEKETGDAKRVEKEGQTGESQKAEQGKVNAGKAKLVLRILPIAANIGIVLLFLSNRDRITLEELLSLSPKGSFAEFWFMTGLYCLKSLSMAFPLMLLHTISGRLFPPGMAFLVNLWGMFCGMTLEYGIGRVSGSGLIDTLRRKWKKVDQVMAIQTKYSWQLALLLRLLGVIPYDVVSLYFGASRQSYVGFILGSLVGLIPSVFFNTLLGVSLSDPGSLLFWLAVLGRCAVAALAALAIWRQQKKE